MSDTRTTLVCTLHFCKVRNLRTGQTWLSYNNLPLSLSSPQYTEHCYLVKIFPKQHNLLTNKQRNKEANNLPHLFFAWRINQVISKSNLPSFPLWVCKSKEGRRRRRRSHKTFVVVHYYYYTLWRKQQHVHFADSFIPITLFLLQSWWLIYTGPGHHVQYI